jgi:hypothetical protein
MTKEFPGASYDNWKTTDPADTAPENAPEPKWEPRTPTAADLASIIVTHIQPPIAMRIFDYQAVRADYDLGWPQGFGATPEDAILDLLAAEETMQDD